MNFIMDSILIGFMAWLGQLVIWIMVTIPLAIVLFVAFRMMLNPRRKR